MQFLVVDTAISAADGMHQAVGFNETGGVNFVAFPLGGDGIKKCFFQKIVVGSASQ
jgi:hypothetical protein